MTDEQDRKPGRPVGAKTRPIDVRLAERKAREEKVDPIAAYREPSGKLKKGAPPLNPSGRAPRAVDERFVDAIKDIVKREDVEAIILKAMEQAKRGNRFARDFLWDRAVGKPRQVVTAPDQKSPLLALFTMWTAQASEASAADKGEEETPLTPAEEAKQRQDWAEYEDLEADYFHGKDDDGDGQCSVTPESSTSSGS